MSNNFCRNLAFKFNLKFICLKFYILAKLANFLKIKTRKFSVKLNLLVKGIAIIDQISSDTFGANSESSDKFRAERSTGSGASFDPFNPSSQFKSTISEQVLMILGIV